MRKAQQPVLKQTAVFAKGLAIERNHIIEGEVINRKEDALTA